MYDWGRKGYECDIGIVLELSQGRDGNFERLIRENDWDDIRNEGMIENEFEGKNGGTNCQSMYKTRRGLVDDMCVVEIGEIGLFCLGGDRMDEGMLCRVPLGNRRSSRGPLLAYEEVVGELGL